MIFGVKKMVDLILLFGSILLVSIISIIGIFLFGTKKQTWKKILPLMVAFSVGVLLGDVFIHILPKAVEEFGFSLNLSLTVLSGIIIFFVIEKLVHFHHHHHHKQIHKIADPHLEYKHYEKCEEEKCKEQPEPFTYMNLIGDALHNFVDGILIAGSYIISMPLGITTTIAVIFHELPQEIADFGVLIYGGFTKEKALKFNFLSALTAFIGAGITLIVSGYIEKIELILIPFTAGGFIYIAGSDLIPELHKNIHFKNSIMQLIALIIGIYTMVLLLGLE